MSPGRTLWLAGMSCWVVGVQGVPLRDVQEAASQADPRTTMRYDHPDVAAGNDREPPFGA